ncbi:hypothetical protein ACN42_g7229 [Penicillium freii]|uniref:Uncharacterized protein n=1 Tax=Penicillium freii TaxID=48697 RepID=A0A117NMX9_PENFR|nr:hypothetical protein ACN42_g7229 [Penicillium freii]
MSSNSRLRPSTTLQAERVVAAYLGFDTIVDLQRFVIMWPCLEAIRLICALPGETSDSLISPSTIEDSQALESNARVRLANEYTQHCWVACVLIVLRHNIAVYETNTSQENRARTIAAIRSLPPRFWIPDHILDEEEEESPVYPILCPTVRFAEPDLIPLHRCLCLLQYLELSHGSVTTRERYLDARVQCTEDDMEVTEEDVPWWMR